MRRHSGSEKRREKARAAWGANLNSVADVVNVFVKYTSGARLPGLLCMAALLGLVRGEAQGPSFETHGDSARYLGRES